MIPNCSEVTTFEFCYPDVKTPDTTLGFKRFDLSAQTSFSVMQDVDLRIRLDVLNVFNWANPDVRNDNLGAVGVRNPDFLRPTSYLQPTRTLKLSFAASWR